MGTQDSEKNDATTHFGYQTVTVEEKQARVRSVFDSVSKRYDLMNDLMSGGVHRLWKRFTVNEAGVRQGQRVLDLAGGTGDLAARFAAQVGPHGKVVLADINASMLREGRDRCLDAGIVDNLDVVQVDAEKLPFDDRSFDVVTIAFGLRNVTNKQAALESMWRVLKPGGKLLVLEFSRPDKLLRPAYDLYSFNVLPWLGKRVANDEESYRYLAESIRMHPDQDTLLAMLGEAGFSHCRYHNLTGGVAALHIGFRC